jgi:hypothetical protein
MDIGQFLRTGSGNCFRDYDMSLVISKPGLFRLIGELVIRVEGQRHHS